MHLRHALSVVAIASAFALHPASAQTAQMTFTSGGSVINTRATGGYGANSFYVGPYTGTMDGTSLFLYCVDFAHEIKVGDSWNANVTTLSGPLDGRTRFSDATLYKQAAWLTTQYAGHAGSTEDIQDAIWYLFNPTLWSASSPGAFTAANDWVIQAKDAKNYASLNFDYFKVVTDNTPSPITGEKQEFLVQVTPEPASLVLMATGLLGIVGVARRRRGSAA